MTNCFNGIGASIQRSCTNPLVKGNSSRLLLIDWNDIDAITIADQKISAITLKESAKAIAVENAVVTPFEGTASASSADDGYRTHTKTLAFRIPERGADVSKEIVDPLTNSSSGFLAVLEKNDKRGDGSFEVLGYEAGLKVNEDGITQNETENGGAIMVTMSSVQNLYAYTLVGAEPTGTATVYSEAKSVFDTLWAGAKAPIY